MRCKADREQTTGKDRTSQMTGIRTLRFRKSSLDKWLAELEKMTG
jgi:hypothetical protein